MEPPAQSNKKDQGKHPVRVQITDDEIHCDVGTGPRSENGYGGGKKLCAGITKRSAVRQWQ
jgi:hypothetical protein